MGSKCYTVLIQEKPVGLNLSRFKQQLIKMRKVNLEYSLNFSPWTSKKVITRGQIWNLVATILSD